VLLALHQDQLSDPAEKLDLLDQARKKPRERPPQAGKVWDTAEEEMLVGEFEAGETVDAIARTHCRTPYAIESRLVRLGRDC
jgi:hypothetical protein